MDSIERLMVLRRANAVRYADDTRPRPKQEKKSASLDDTARSPHAAKRMPSTSFWARGETMTRKRILALHLPGHPPRLSKRSILEIVKKILRPAEKVKSTGAAKNHRTLHSALSFKCAANSASVLSDTEGVLKDLSKLIAGMEQQIAEEQLENGRLRATLARKELDIAGLKTRISKVEVDEWVEKGAKKMAAVLEEKYEGLVRAAEKIAESRESGKEMERKVDELVGVVKRMSVRW